MNFNVPDAGPVSTAGRTQLKIEKSWQKSACTTCDRLLKTAPRTMRV